MSAERTADLAEEVAEARPCPWPIRMNGTGDVNGEQFTVEGRGTIRTRGVYDATLDFDGLPEGLHPSGIAMLGVSTSCAAQAATRNGAKNFYERGYREYDSTRVLTVGGNQLTLEATSKYKEECLEIDLHVSGQADMPADLAGYSSYFVRLDPTEDRRIVGAGEVSMYRQSGRAVEGRIDSEYTSIEPDPLPDPMTGPEYRVVSEDGTLDGTTYDTRIHTMLDGAHSVAALDGMESDFE